MSALKFNLGSGQLLPGSQPTTTNHNPPQSHLYLGTFARLENLPRLSKPRLLSSSSPPLLLSSSPEDIRNVEGYRPGSDVPSAQK